MDPVVSGSHIWPKVVKMYNYNCTVEKVIDGDTLDLTIDLGFGVSFRDRFRLWNVGGQFNAPEIRGKEKLQGLAAKDYVIDWTRQHGPIFTVFTHKDKRGKYGRWLADVWTSSGASLTADMLAAGHATL